MSNTKFQFKRTTISGRLPNTTISANTSYIDAGEFAINLADGKVVSSNGTVTFEVGANLSSLNVATSIAVGGATINSTIYSATANNANNLGGLSLGQVQGNAAANAATAYTNATIYSANASNLGNGTVAPARLGSGTANSTTVLYGNSVWAGLPTFFGSAVVSQQFTANGTANSFTISGGYTANQVAVFVNGVKQLPATDVDITSGTTINLASTPLNGYAVDVFGYNTVVAGSVDLANTATYLSNSSGTLVNIQNYITGNAATAYTNATSYADIKAGNAYTNATSYADTKAANAYTNATSYADTKAANAYSNATSYADTKAGTAYTNAITYSANADNISSGTVSPARLGSGTANSTTILYGNGVFAAPTLGSTNVDAQYAWTNTNSFSANVLIAGNATSQLLIGTINATSIGVLANSTVLTVGNSSVNTTINATSFSGIANNANNLGGTSLATLQTQITGNAATAYTNATSYADTAAGTAYTNATSYADTKAANAYTNATSYADTKAGTAYTNATSYADTKAGNAYTNATTYVTTGGYTISGVVNYSGNVILTSGNGTNQLLIGTINATSIGLLANSTILTIGNSSVNTTVNATSFSGIANNANNLGGTSLTTLQTQITGNAATAYTNATSYADTKAGTAYTNATSYADTAAGTAYTNATSYADTKAGNAYTNATTYVTTGGYTITGVVTHSGNVILTSGNATNQLLIGTINATSIGMLANSTVLTIGNSTINTTINSTALTTISNTATFGTAAYIIANGNVGIANSAPGSKLTISGGVSSFEALLEKATVSATAATGTVHLDVLTQAVLYYTSNATANFTLNVRANNTVTANSILVNGQSLTVAFLNTTGATAYYPNVFSIDSTTVTPKFSGGTAYTAGNANSIDTYTFTIIKTANSTYTVLANQTQYK